MNEISIFSNARWVQKVSRLKFYLLKEKRTMNDNFDFFKRDELKKSIEIEVLFTKRKMSNEWNINFL